MHLLITTVRIYPSHHINGCSCRSTTLHHVPMYTWQWEPGEKTSRIVLASSPSICCAGKPTPYTYMDVFSVIFELDFNNPGVLLNHGRRAYDSRRSLFQEVLWTCGVVCGKLRHATYKTCLKCGLGRAFRIAPFLNAGNVCSCLVPQSTSPQPTEEGSHMATVERTSQTTCSQVPHSTSGWILQDALGIALFPAAALYFVTQIKINYAW